MKFFEGPTKSPDVRGNPVPNYMVGRGYENAGYVAINAIKEETVRGVFTNTNRKNVLQARDYKQTLNPPTYNAYLSNGVIPTQESPLSSHTVPGCIPKSPTHKSPFINRNPLLNT